MSADRNAMLRAARLAVHRGCAICRHVQLEMLSGAASGGGASSITKGDKSPVTIADFASQAIVAHTLRETLGAAPVLLAEEGSDYLRDPNHADQRSAALRALRTQWPDATEASMLEAIDIGGAPMPADGRFWTLDPIDGTKGFLRGEQYAVCLAFIEGGQPTLAALGCPNLSHDFKRAFDDPDPRGEMYLAVKGGGALRVAADDPNTDPSRMARPAMPHPRRIRACQSVDSGHSDQSAAVRVLAAACAPEQPGEPARLDSQCKYAVVARGQADAYLRLPTPGKPYVERIWDHAAGALVATEAGCTVTDIHGRPLDFSHGRGLERNQGVICADPSALQRLVEAIEATRPK